MKTEMKMLPNGNYEKVISPIQHECRSKDGSWVCIEYGWEDPKLTLKVEEDPCEGGLSSEIKVLFCPFCGYQPERLNPEAPKGDAIV